MSSVLRSLQLLAMTLWVGGIAFFAFVVAPVAFQNLPNAHEAGIVVRGSILILHRIGFASGIVFLASIIALCKHINRRFFLPQAALAVLMLALTFISQYRVLPAMEVDRLAAAGTIEQANIDDPHRIHFERLHILSERIEGTILLMGFAVLILVAVQRPSTEASA